MANDFSLDPLQIEEDILNQQYKDAIARRLRTPQAPAYDIGTNALTIMDNLNARFEIPKLEKKRKDLSEKFEASLVEALRGQDPEIQALASHPATRTEGLALMKKRQQQRLDQEDMDRITARMGGGRALPQTVGADGPPQGGNIPSLQEVAAMRMHPNKSIQERGEALYKMYYEPQDPQKSVQRTPGGGYAPIPGAYDALSQQAHIKNINDPTQIQVPDGQGGMRYTTRGEEYRRSLSLPATGGAGPGAPSVQQPGGPPASGPIPPAFGPNSPPPPTAPGGPGLPPEAQQLIALIRSPEVPIQIKDQAAAMLSKMGVNFSGLSSDPNSRPQATMGPPSALPQTTGSIRERPVAPPGTTPPKDRTELFQKTREADLDQLKKAEESLPDVALFGEQLNRLKDLNTQPTSSGLAFDIQKGVNYVLPGSMGATYANSRAMEALVKEMSGPRAKMFGYNPSNVDLNTALASLPTMSDDPKTRTAVIAQLEKGVQYHMASLSVIRGLVEQGMSLPQAQQTFDKMYKEYQRQQSQGQGAPNPTGAGSAPTSALPATVAARNAPTSDPTDPNHPGNRYNPLESTAYWAGQLPKSIFSSQGAEAATDVLKNKWEGAKELLGLGDREAAMVEKKRQEDITDPKYYQARQFFDVFNPTNMIPGSTLAKTTGAAIASSALDPQESWGAQIAEGLKGGLTNLAFAGVANKVAPTTRLAKEINVEGTGDELLNAFPSFKPTSAQVNPRNLETPLQVSAGLNDAARLSQSKAITKDLMAKAGIEGTELTSKNIAARMGDINDELTTFLAPNIKVKIDALDRKAFTEAAEALYKLEPMMAKTPTLSAIRKALQSKRAVMISAADLHRGWKEIKEVGGDQETIQGVRGVLEKLITKALPEGEEKVFQSLNSQWDLLRDIDQLYHAGSQGKGPAAGFLAPSKIEQYVSSNRVHSSPIDQAVQLIKKFNVRDYQPAQISTESLISPVTSAIQPITGAILKATEIPTAIRQSEPVKRIIEVLRAGGMRGWSATDDLRE